MFELLIRVTKRPSLSIQQILERGVASQRPNVNLEVQRDVLAAVVEGCDGSTHFVKTVLQIQLLPFPEDAIDVAVVKVEKRV
jgi:hypothetical protein